MNAIHAHRDWGSILLAALLVVTHDGAVAGAADQAPKSSMSC